MRDDDNELALRAHIRKLLLDYAYTHLTVDHVQYSETIVSEILAKILKPIPTHGPNELPLPVDPFETLKTKLKFDALTPYDEVWQPTSETLQLLKEVTVLPKAKLRTEKVWDEDDEFDYESMPHRPMSPPVLSRSSRRKTPSLGKTAKANRNTETLVASLSSHWVRSAPDEQLTEEKPVKLEDCLDLKLTIDASTHASMIEFQQQVPFLGRPVPRSLPMHAAEFLRSHSPDYEERFRPISPPIFAREQRIRPKSECTHNIFGPIKPVPVEVSDIDPDIATESMKIIDGWATLPSSISTPSLSPGSSKVDELEEDAEFWRPSSSAGIPSAIESLETAKMEEPIFPRSERPRAGRFDKAGVKPRQSLSSFIAAHIPSKSSIRIRTEPSSDDALLKREHSPSPSAPAPSLSMIGQPPSECDTSSTKTMSDPAFDTLDKDIRRILKVHGASQQMKSYHDIIMDEPLDEKQAMFMEVPRLPQPNEYLHNAAKLVPGRKASDLNRSLPGQDGSKPKFSLPANFKKVTGVKSLNLELSWRPFSFGSKIPTHEELAGVDSLFSLKKDLPGDEEIPSIESVEKLLADLNFPLELDASSDTSVPKALRRQIPSHDLYILNGIHSDDISDKLKPRFDPNRDFDEDVLLLSRSDRYGLNCRPINQILQHASTNGALPSNEPQSNETSDFSSAVTHEFDAPHLPYKYADDINICADPYPYAPGDETVYDEVNGDYNYDRAYDDLDTSRDRKKRRLTSAELNALCSVETISQPFPVTIDPRDLVLPQTNGSSGTDDQDPSNPVALPTYNVQTAFVPSQSLSLSLSLYEDATSQENIGITTLESMNDEHVLRNSQNAVRVVFKDSDTVVRIANQDLRQASLLAAELDQPYQRSGERLGSVSRCKSTVFSDTQQLESVPLVGKSPIHLDASRSSGCEPNVQSVHSSSDSNKQRPVDLDALSALLSDKTRLSRFLALRGRQDILDVNPTTYEIEPLPGEDDALHATKNIPADADIFREPAHYSAPPDLISDTRAFSVPGHWQLPTVQHTYLVSVDFMQQRGLVHALESRCAVHLVERDVIGTLLSDPTSTRRAPQASTDISIITGPHSGVVLFPLSTLPSQNAYKTLLDSLALHSWRFSNILLILMAFPRSHLIRTTNAERDFQEGPSSYSPPALKAARRVRRDLALREGTGEKKASCSIDLAFADHIEQAAMFVRAFGDRALQDSTVDYTHYIDGEEQEGERDLAELEGMNAFCAAAILRCCTLEEFLEMPPEGRTEGLADIIGKERIERVNAILSSRMQAMDMDVSSFTEFVSTNG